MSNRKPAPYVIIEISPIAIADHSCPCSYSCDVDTFRMFSIALSLIVVLQFHAHTHPPAHPFPSWHVRVHMWYTHALYDMPFHTSRHVTSHVDDQKEENQGDETEGDDDDAILGPPCLLDEFLGAPCDHVQFLSSFI
mmetsp:Transcript_12158/g.33476  ORF Transcript_12158/g.33476 Transcript_12158/m.33476 type:complete len:137 (+) Transcript_12158:933-1343(+)